MRDMKGNTLVFIGQPWLDPRGTLYGEEETCLLIRPSSMTIKGGKYERIPKSGFVIVPLMNYEQFLEWKKTHSELPPLEVQEPEEKPSMMYSRFDIMEIEEA